jgi:hypothetical protein
MPRELVERIHDFRFAHRLPSRAEAIRQLIEAGLEASEPGGSPGPGKRRTLSAPSQPAATLVCPSAISGSRWDTKFPHKNRPPSMGRGSGVRDRKAALGSKNGLGVLPREGA